MAERSDPGKRLIYWGIGGFVAMCIVLVGIGPMLAPAVDPEEGYPVDEIAKPDTDGTFTVTLDTSSQTRWVPFDFGLGRITANASHADIAVRRYILRASTGAINLGDVPLLDAAVDDDADWEQDKEVDGALQNPAFAAWYTYSYWTHQLSPKGETYAVKRADGGVAYMRFESYYCEPEGTGCMTIRYRLD